MSGESGLRMVSKGSGWDKRTYAGDAERFLPTRGGRALPAAGSGLRDWEPKAAAKGGRDWGTDMVEGNKQMLF